MTAKQNPHELADFETFIRTTCRGVVIALNDAVYAAELHQYASKGLNPAAMLIEEVDFSAIGRALGAVANKVRTLADRLWPICSSSGIGSPKTKMEYTSLTLPSLKESSLNGCPLH